MNPVQDNKTPELNMNTENKVANLFLDLQQTQEATLAFHLQL